MSKSLILSGSVLRRLTSKVVEIQEKPENPKSDYAVVGAYIYDKRVFDIIDHIKPLQEASTR